MSKKKIVFCTFYILMASFLASTTSLKFGTLSVNVSGKLGIFWEGGGGGMWFYS